MDKNIAQSVISNYLQLKLITELALDFSITIEDNDLIDEQKTLIENFLRKLSPMQREQFDQNVEKIMEAKGQEFAKNQLE